MAKRKSVESKLSIGEALTKFDAVNFVDFLRKRFNSKEALIKIKDMKENYLLSTEGVRYGSLQKNEELLYRKIKMLEELIPYYQSIKLIEIEEDYDKID